jgi:hypothetical protein
MAGSGDETVEGAGGRSYLRPPYADRERVIDALKSAFAQGRLTKVEFDLRIGQALAAYAELDALTADIPGGLTAPRSSESPPESHRRKLIQRGTAAGAGASMVFTAAEVIVGGGSPIVGLVVVPLVGSFAAVLLAALLTLLSWVLKRDPSTQHSRGAPGANINASQYLSPADSAGQLPPATRERPHIADAARSYLPRTVIHFSTGLVIHRYTEADQPV